MTEENKSLIVGTDLTAVDLYTAENMDVLLEKIRGEVEAIVPDATTPKGRGEIISLAYKVTQSKSLILEAGLKLTEDWRKNTKTVNSAKKTADEFLTDLAKDIRKPVTDFEEAEAKKAEEERIAEEKRINDIRTVISGMSDNLLTCVGKNSIEIQEILYSVEDIAVNEESFGEFKDAAWATKEEVVAKLRNMRNAIHLQEQEAIRIEKEKAELAEQEKERAAKQQIEDDERQKKLDEEKAQLEQDRKKLAADQAEIDRQKAAIAAEKETPPEPAEIPKKVESPSVGETTTMVIMDEAAFVKPDPKEVAITSLAVIISDEDTAELIIDAIINGDIDHVTFNEPVKA